MTAYIARHSVCTACELTRDAGALEKQPHAVGSTVGSNYLPVVPKWFLCSQSSHMGDHWERQMFWEATYENQNTERLLRWVPGELSLRIFSTCLEPLYEVSCHIETAVCELAHTL